MKKFLAILIVAAAVSTAAFAQADFRLSAGALVGVDFSGTTDSDDKGSTFGFGFGAFFDATYVSLNVGMDIVTPYYDGETISGKDPTNFLTLGLLGKYPISLSDQLTLAPALGFDYLMYLNSGDAKRQDAIDASSASDVAEQMDTFVLKLGAVIDYSFTDALYLRGQVLGTFGLPHKDSDPADSTIGADIKIGIGYRF